MKHVFRLLLVSMLVLGLSTVASGYQTFFGEDLGQGESVRLAATPNASAARANFLSNLVGVGTENFDSYSDNTYGPLNINFAGAGIATLSGTGYVNEVASGTNGVGRYPTSGNMYWETGDTFSIAFSAPVAAFGFYGVDIGDFGGQVTVTFLDGTSTVINIPNTMNGSGGSVLFFGYINTANPFRSLNFGNTAAGVDYFGFDDMTIGSVEQVKPTPEPTTMLLLGLGVLGLAGLRKRD